MSISKDYEDKLAIPEIEPQDPNKRLARKKLEDYLEKKRLREEFEDELGAEFDWGE